MNEFYMFTSIPNYGQFMNDMEEAGRELELYNGRGLYRGPAVRVEDEDEIQKVIRETEVILQWDNMGKGYIVYPKRGGKWKKKKIY